MIIWVTMKFKYALFAFFWYSLPLLAGIQAHNRHYKIAVCDWMILKRQKVGSFELVKELKGDGVEMDMGGLGKRDSFDNKLRQPHFQKLFKDKSNEHKVTIASIAMSAFYGQSFVDRSNYKELVQDCLNTMNVME